ncbi:MAG TPA: MFS transporter [Thermomicrobiales bacterium]|nr:MFS transporter [Thermomicrobiales bacterium]
MPSTRTTSRILMLITFLAFVSIGFPDAVLGVAWPLMRITFDRPISSLGFILVASGAGYFASGVFAGRALERLGVGRLLALSTTLVTIGLYGYTFSPTFWPLLGAAILIGVGSGAVDAGLNFFASEHFSVTVMNWLHAFFGIGAMVGPFLMSGVFAAGGSWRIGYFIVSSLIAAMAITFWLTSDRWNEGGHAEAEAEAARISMRYVLGLPEVWLQICIFAVMCGIEASAGNWTATVMTGRFDASESQAGIWAGIFWGSMAVGRIALVPLSRGMDPARLVQICTWAILLGAFLTTRDPEGWYKTGLIVFGLGMAPMFPTLMSLTPQRLGSQVSLHAIGFQVSAATLGIVSIPSLGGILAERTSLVAIPWIMTIGAIVVIALEMTLRAGVNRKTAIA